MYLYDIRYDLPPANWSISNEINIFIILKRKGLWNEKDHIYSEADCLRLTKNRQKSSQQHMDMIPHHAIENVLTLPIIGLNVSESLRLWHISASFAFVKPGQPMILPPAQWYRPSYASLVYNNWLNIQRDRSDVNMYFQYQFCQLKTLKFLILKK